MKAKIQFFLLAALLVGPHAARAQGTAFTYQGQLNSGGAPVNGSYDLKFTLYATNVSGLALAGPVTNPAVAVTNGLFTTLVAFGPGVFTGGSNWLEIAVSTNAANAFGTLAPRQQLTPAPYAITAENVSGAVSASQLVGGTISTNVLPGFQGPYYATVGGGLDNTANSIYGSVGGGQANAANNAYGTVGGGFGNTAGYLAVVGGGEDNTASGAYATVPGGANNVAGGQYSLAAGQRAKALHQGTFVWADSQAADFSSTTNDQFIIRAQNGVGIGTNGTAANALTVAGNVAATTFSGSGAGLSNLSAGSLTGTITSASLAPGAAAANLAAGSQTAVPSGGVIMTISGGIQEANLLNAGYVKISSLNLIPESWNASAELQTGPLTYTEPSARENAAAVWTGSEMLVWGGDNSGVLLRSGGIFNLAANTWSVITTTNAPSARQNYTALWTGNSMLIWGGQNGGNTVSTGGRYYPASGTWSATSLSNAPVNRASHVAVWDGKEMLVWGGYETTLLRALTGGRYNPLTDTWLPMNSTNAPPVTYGAAAVWTGTNMLVWGGNAGNALGDDYVASGGMYNPALDAWTPLPTNNAPSPRAGHSAVWTGTDCLVYGGFNATTNLNSGARFTAASNTWTALSLSNAPPPLAGDVIVWSGIKMLIYGGTYPYQSSIAENAWVELYDPAQDSWSYSIEGPVEAALENASGVWAGLGFLVWGGYSEDSGQYYNQPYLYTPQLVMDLLLRP